MKPAAPASTAAQPQANGKPVSSAAPPKSKEEEKEERKRKRRMAALEEEIAMLEAELRQLESDMAAAATDAKRVTSLSMQYSDVQEMLQTRYDEWAAVAG